MVRKITLVQGAISQHLFVSFRIWQETRPEWDKERRALQGVIGLLDKEEQSPFPGQLFSSQAYTCVPNVVKIS